jgi:BASS family bile acid:Na+ symporter
VFTAQLLPLALGMATRRFWTSGATWLEPRLRRLGTVLLLLLVTLALIDVWPTVVGAGFRVALAIVTVTVLALAVGHGLGGPDSATRTATAISSAIRNAGLALLVATLNKAAPAITATILAYLVISALTVIPYVIWRRRTARVMAT